MVPGTSMATVGFISSADSNFAFSDIVIANVMLSHRDQRCYYNPVVGMQDISDESDEATSHPIERVPSLFGAAADRDIVDLHTLEQKAVDGNTPFFV